MRISPRALIPLLMFLALGVVLAIGLTRDPSKIPSNLIDRPFPQIELTDLFDEQNILTRDIVLGHVSLVNVFGSWCVACVSEHPVLRGLAKSGQARLIGVDWRDTRADGQDWLARGGNPYTHVVFDPHGKLAIDLGVTGAPETYIVDKTGTIRYKHIGVITRKNWKSTLKPLVLALEREGGES